VEHRGCYGDGATIHNVAGLAGPPKTVFIMATGDLREQDQRPKLGARDMQKSLPWEYPRRKIICAAIAVDPANPKRVLLGFGDFTPGRRAPSRNRKTSERNGKLLPLPVEPNSTHVDVRTNSDDPKYDVCREYVYGYLYRSDDAGRLMDEAAQGAERDRSGVLLPN